MSVTIRPCMLVPKADDVTELVYDYSKFVAIFSDTNGLWSISSLADEGTTSVKQIWLKRLLQKILQRSI